MEQIRERNNPLILIVDDNPANITLIKSHINKQGYDYLIATNGLEAIQFAQESLPDLILLDVMMPIMSGFEVIEQLKQIEKTSMIPVIFLTAATGQDDMVKGFALGAVDYITKPFNASELYARLKTHLQLQQYQRKINQDKLVLQKLNTEKNEILGIVAHDLKNPLYNISMLAKIIHNDKSINREEIDEFSEDILTTSDKMLELIKNLLDINAIDAGQVNLNIESCNLTRILSEIVELFAKRAKTKNINLIWNVPSEDILIQTDCQALLHILDNVISNAVKYTLPNKSVIININRHVENVTISVTDEGPGFTEDDKANLYKRYKKLSSQPTGGEHSSGLGLSIVKKYIELINAKIELETVLGKGSTFFIKLPL